MFKPIRYSLLSAILLALGFLACEPEEERIKRDSNLQLTFSADTVSFDTVITGAESEVRNITRRLLVFNPYDHAIDLEAIRLAGGNASAYKLTINGIRTASANNQLLLGGDSLLILIQLQIDPRDRNTPFLVKDSILFAHNDHIQDVKLRGYGQDAHFLKKGVLACSQTWEAGKAYVIQDTVWIAEGCTLSIDKGTKVYFDNHAALMVGGTLQAIGTQEERILFQNSRLDIKNQVGLWAGIRFDSTSKNNQILYSDIRNAHTGIFLEIADQDTLPDLIVGHSRIENTSAQGIDARGGADLYVFNSLINNAAGHILRHEGGGNYVYIHNTLVNYATLGFSANNPVMFYDRQVSDPTPLSMRLYNNIIWSGGNLNYNSDLLIDDPVGNYNLTMGNNLIRSVDESLAVNGNIINTQPDFPDFAGIFQYNYRLDSLSPAINKGAVTDFLLDLEDNERDSLPDIGAYEYVKE